MTSRERVQCVLNGKLPDRVPFNFWMDRDKMAELDERWGHDFRITHYGADVIEAFVGLAWWADLERKTVNDGKTSWLVEPLIADLREAFKCKFPNPKDSAVYADIESKRAKYPDKAIFAMMGAPFDILRPLKLEENLFIDFLDKPDIIHELLGEIKPILIEAARRTCALDIDVLYLAADICGRNGAMMSPKHLREFQFDYLRDVINTAHEAGKKVFYHTDGYVLDILDFFIEYGIDGINPLEPRYNDSAEFMRKSEGKLALYGGGDNCDIIPNGTVEDVQAHVRSQFEILGSEGKWIFSTHDIPSSCPQENLDAMAEAVKSCRY